MRGTLETAHFKQQSHTTTSSRDETHEHTTDYTWLHLQHLQAPLALKLFSKGKFSWTAAPIASMFAPEALSESPIDSSSVSMGFIICHKFA